MAKHRETQSVVRGRASETLPEGRRRPALFTSRWEIVGLLAILTAGTLLRCAFPSRLAVEHFDEGVYASNIWFGAEDDNQYPLRYFYAPPLLPTLIEVALILQNVIDPGSGASSALTVMLPSLVAGSLTPLALWWLARRWFTPAVALGAAALSAFSDFHVLYSRAALTDCLLALFLVSAVGWIERAVSRGGARAILAAGALTAAAWWTKYNGWLPLAIGAAGASLVWMIDSQTWTAARKMAGRWLAIAAVALLAWLPVLISLAPLGGYETVAANHARYVVGLAGWPASVVRQHASLQYLDGFITLAGLGVAIAAMARIRSLHRENGLPLTAVSGVLISTSLAAWCGSHVILLALGSIGLASRLWHWKRWTNGASLTGLCYLAAWFGGLLIVTPLYHPYPRLLLPWLCSAWLAASLGIEALFDLNLARTGSHRRLVGWVTLGVLITAAGAALALRTPRLLHRGVPGWSDRTGMQQVSTSIQARTPDTVSAFPRQSLYCVYGEPSLFFQLCARGVKPVIAVGELPRAEDFTDPEPVRLILIVGPHARRSSDFEAKWKKAQPGFRRLSVHRYWPSDLVLLDNYDPRQFDDMRWPIEEQVTAYVVR